MSSININAQQLVAMRKKHSKICPVCGIAFQGINIKIYCSKKCKGKAAVLKKKQKRKLSKKEAAKN